MLDVTGSAVTSIPLGMSETFGFTGVPPGTYTLSLRAANGAGVSSSSNAVTLTFPGACSGAPQPPTGVVATRSGNVITVLWDPPTTGAAATSYVLNVTGSFVGSFATTGRGLSGAVAAGSYNLSVAAVNSCGASASTTPVTVTVP